MSDSVGRVLLLFLDGVGIGEDDARTNPLVRAPLRVLTELLGGHRPVRGEVGGGELRRGGAWVTAADATLGVAGRPQSGTGQTALLTGENAPALLGRHFGPWVPTSLRALLAERNLLTRARRAGLAAAFANAYPAGHMETGRGSRRPAAPPLAALAAGVLTRDAETLRAGRAVASSIDNEAWRRYLDPAAPEVTAPEAGRVLAGVCAEAEVTLFAHYDTDLAGHRQEMEPALAALERVDAFLGGLLGALPADALLVIASDHGNLEDVRVGHTLNPVPVIAVGPGARVVAERVRAITDVVPALLERLNVH